MSPATELREAADAMRQRASAATPGPWRVCGEGSEGSRIAPDSADKRERTRFIGILNGRVQPEDGRNARYIATVHPGLGMAIANLLETVAGALETGGSPAAQVAVDALAIARQVNGGADS